jgi:hypothetical protein
MLGHASTRLVEVRKSRTGSVSPGCLFDQGGGDFRKINPGKEFHHDQRLKRDNRAKLTFFTPFSGRR